MEGKRLRKKLRGTPHRQTIYQNQKGKREDSYNFKFAGAECISLEELGGKGIRKTKWEVQNPGEELRSKS